MTEHRWNMPPSRGASAAMVAVAAVLAAVLIPAMLLVIQHRTADGGTRQPPPAPAQSESAAVADPHAVLTQLAATLQPASSDGHTGTFEYVAAHAVEQSIPATGEPTWQTAPIHRLLQSWTTAAGHGRGVAVNLADGTPTCPPESDEIWNEANPWDGPMATTDAGVLHQLTDGRPPATTARPDGVNLLVQYGEQALTRIQPLATRAAAIRLIASQPGIEVRRDEHDQAGRPGIAITTTITVPFVAEPQRRTLILDQHTGEVLAFEQQPMTKFVVDRPGFVILDRTYTNDLNSPATSCLSYRRS